MVSRLNKFNFAIFLTFIVCVRRFEKVMIKNDVILDEVVLKSSSSSSSSSFSSLLPSSKDNKNKDDATFCQQEGSLHQIALDMIHYSSPRGSASYQKLQHIVQQNPTFFLEVKVPILTEVEQNIARLLQGFDLEQTTSPPSNTETNVTLIQNAWGSKLCNLVKPECRNTTRIILQSEQINGLQQNRIAPQFRLCHQSPNCIVLEFSDYNYVWAREQGLADSFVLLPIMNQATSRLLPQNQGMSKANSNLQPLSNRDLDVVFFGAATQRRQAILQMSQHYATTKNWTNIVLPPKPKQTNNFNNFMVESYLNAKVCLVAHSYHDEAGGGKTTEVFHNGCTQACTHVAHMFVFLP